LLCKENPIISCLQETKFRANFKPVYRGYHAFYRNKNSHTNAHGGVLTLIKSNISCSEVHLNTEIQAVAVRVNFPYEMVICNIYTPHTEIFSADDWLDLIRQLGPKYMLSGDFNAHSTSWGSKKNCSRGDILNEVIEEEYLVLLNTGNQTHFSLGTKSFSAIDLTLGCPFFSSKNPGKFKKTVNFKKISEKFDKKSGFPF
jgi:Endonuclease-reverse transcriptase